MSTTKAFFLLIIVLLFASSLLHAEEKKNKILSSSISLTNLLDNEELCVGKTVTIEWAGVDAAEEVIIEYSTNGGSNWIEITATATGLSYDWTVPNTPSDNVLVRVKAPYDPCADACVDGGVQIGTQIWTCKNLDVTTYRNGDSIPQVTDPSAWANLTTGAWCYYSNNPSSNTIYGKLYNWYAVNDPRGLAPTGWHVPTDDEWKTLEIYLGMSQAQADDDGWRGTDEGGKLKESGFSHWLSPNTGATNELCFTALPGGYRSYDGGFFNDISGYGHFWTATVNSATRAWMRTQIYNNARSYRTYPEKENGFSVRCVRD